eukprot:6154094-Pyramimonas_sp.AAC.1
MARGLALSRTRGAIRRIHPYADGTRQADSANDAREVAITIEDEGSFAHVGAMAAGAPDPTSPGIEEPISITSELT